jgi:hypothetical protein
MSKYLWLLPRGRERTAFRVHETARHVRRLLPAPVFADFTKIAFVRNPYSWLVSLYELVLQSPNHRHFRQVSALGGFHGYVDWEIARRKRYQHPYVLDRHGRMLVDRIGYYEKLSADAVAIFTELGVELAPLPRVGQFTRRDYRDYYDQATRRRDADHWARDLALFGYEFEGLAAVR